MDPSGSARSASEKSFDFASLLISVDDWMFFTRPSPAPNQQRAIPKLRGLVDNVVTTAHSPFVWGSAAVLGAIAIGATWFWCTTKETAQNEVAKVHAENQRLFEEIDRLSRDNEMLLEGNTRAQQLNQEVRTLDTFAVETMLLRYPFLLSCAASYSIFCHISLKSALF